MGDAYNPIRADATKARFKNDASGDDKVAFLKWYVAHAIHHPYTFVMAVVANDLTLHVYAVPAMLALACTRPITIPYMRRMQGTGQGQDPS